MYGCSLRERARRGVGGGELVLEWGGENRELQSCTRRGDKDLGRGTGEWHWGQALGKRHLGIALEHTPGDQSRGNGVCAILFAKVKGEIHLRTYMGTTTLLAAPAQVITPHPSTPTTTIGSMQTLTE